MDKTLSDLDFEQRIVKLMSFVSISHNKNLSPVAFFLMMLQHEDLREIAVKHLDLSFFDLVKRMAHIYPVLYKSRKINNYIVKNDVRLDSNAL